MKRRVLAVLAAALTLGPLTLHATAAQASRAGFNLEIGTVGEGRG